MIRRTFSSMKMPGSVILTVTLLVSAFSGRVMGDPPHQDMIAGVTRGEALRLGERMYREGILPSGEPLKAVVKGDIPMEGNQFTCANCHQKSGFGSLEGTIRTPPINSAQLYSPLSTFKGVPMSRRSVVIQQTDIFRPAYTDETLARALRTGQDPAGRQMSSTMPIYFLNDRDMAILVFYLRNLSSGSEDGVTDNTLRFATVITDEVSKDDSEAMLAPLQYYINNWRISRQMERSFRAGAFVQEGEARELRRLSLAVWVLKGPADTWRAQLEEYYRRGPVFALLGGITTGEWAPIHAFCEDHKVPAIFPITDYPVVDGAGGHTFYLSKGYYQEGEAAARFLHRSAQLPEDMSIVQVFRNDRSGRVLSTAFEATWTGLGHTAPDNIVLPGGTAPPEGFWHKPGDKNKHHAVILWLDAGAYPVLESLAASNNAPHIVIASSSLLGDRFPAVPERVRPYLFLTYPYSLPQEARVYKANIETALKRNKMTITNPEITFKMYSLFSVLTGPLSRMRTYVYRDYFIELLEATPDLSMTPVMYPRLSFGTGQRYASKGCYIVQLTAGPQPEVIRRSEWIIQ
jgi:hypothetical protein